MRGLMTLTIGALVLAGCEHGETPVAKRQKPGAAQTEREVRTAAARPSGQTAAEPPAPAVPASGVPNSNVSASNSAPSDAAESKLNREELTELIRRVVAEELAK